MIASIRRALTLLDRRDRWHWLALVPLALVVAAFEAVGAGAVFLLVRRVAAPDPPRAILTFAAAIAVFYVVRNVVLVALEYAEERIVQRTASRIAVRLLARYLGAPYAFHFRRSSASLMHGVRDSVDTVVEMVLAATVHIASEVLVVAGLLTLLAVTAPAETFAAVAAVIVLIVAPLGLTRRLYARWGQEEHRVGERMVEHLKQSLDTVKEILVSGHADHFVDRYARDRAALERLKRRRHLATTTLRLGVETVFICAMLLAVSMLTLAGRTGPDAVSVLSLFAYAGFRVVPSANRIILNTNLLRFGGGFVEALAADWSALSARGTPSATPLPPLAEAIVCEAVSFRYEDARALALDRVSFTIPKGTSLGVVGPTGSGKSTIIDVVLGLLTPESGRVLVDGRDIAGLGAAWLAQVGYVPQDVTLVDDTLRRNIAFGVDDRHVDEARIASAVRSAQLEAVVAALPGGLDAPMGDRGVRLSGGERQRIAIARALYHEPAVLVFDEATSALDTQTEREVADAIDRARGERTVIVIAHRLATVRHCDQIIVLDGGRLVARGRYDELLAASDVFRALASSS